MDDIETMQKYCLKPCYVVKRLSTDEIKHEDYIPVEVLVGNKRTQISFINYFHEYASFSFLSSEVYNLPELINGLCKSLTIQSKLLKKFLLVYEYETGSAFCISEPYSLSCRYFMYKWTDEKGIPKMKLTEIKISGRLVPLEKRIVGGKLGIGGDYEYAIRCLRMNGIKIRERNEINDFR